MKKENTQKWIIDNSKKELPMLVLLVIGNALFAVCGVLTALFSKNIIDCAQNGNRSELVHYGIILFAIFAAQIILRMLMKSLEVRVQGRIEMKIKTDLFSSILKKDYMKITEVHSGQLMTRLTSDVSVITDGITTIVPSVVSMATRLISALVLLFVLDKAFALVLAAAGVVLFLITRLFRGKMKHLHKRVQESDGKVRSFMQEAIESMLVVKIFDVQEKIRNQSVEIQEENYDAKIVRNRWSVFANIGFSAAFSFGYLFAIVWSGLRLLSGSISFGTLTAIIQLVNQVQTPVTSLSGILPKYYSMLASADRIIEIENMSESKALNSSDIDTKQIYNELESIEFKDVSFGYDRDMVMENSSFNIKKGDFIVISGISGIGKSTLFKLMVGVLQPLSGEVFINSGNKKYPVDKYTRPLFAYVPQGNILMSGTIRDNIKFVNDKASDEDVLNAAKISCAFDFISELPDGLDTVLFENGRGLSEGQVQRLAVARAVLSEAPVILLDEATSALDEETEMKMLKNIKALKNKTCVIISHKQAAFHICNAEIVVSEKKAQINKL